jgi:hypothetical protein
MEDKGWGWCDCDWDTVEDFSNVPCGCGDPECRLRLYRDPVIHFRAAHWRLACAFDEVCKNLQEQVYREIDVRGALLVFSDEKNWREVEGWEDSWVEWRERFVEPWKIAQEGLGKRGE